MLSGVIPHIRAITTRKPKLDALTQKLVTLPTAGRMEAYYQRWERAAANGLKDANVYRHLLYICCLLLLAAVVYAFLALHGNNRHLDDRVRARTNELSAANGRL